MQKNIYIFGKLTSPKLNYLISWARILVQVTIYRRLLIGRDDQSKAYDIL